MHKKYVPPPDLNSKPEAIDEVARTMDNIVLSENDFTKIERLPSGTIMTTRLQATPEELAEAKRIKLERRKTSALAAGSADIDGSFEPGLERTIAPTPPAQPLGDLTTTRIDR